MTRTSQEQLDKVMKKLCPHNDAETEGTMKIAEWTNLYCQSRWKDHKDLSHQLPKSSMEK
jgi:hypothetical protein